MEVEHSESDAKTTKQEDPTKQEDTVKRYNESLWQQFLSGFAELLTTGYNLPAVLQTQAIRKVEREIKLWRVQLKKSKVQLENSEVPYDGTSDDEPTGMDVSDCSEVQGQDSSISAGVENMASLIPVDENIVKSEVTDVDDLGTDETTQRMTRRKGRGRPKNVHTRWGQGKKNQKKIKAKPLKHGEPVVCKICNVQVSTKRNLPEHMLKHGPIPCELCDKTFKSTSGLRLHDVMVHNPSNRMMKCDLCDFYAPNKSNLERHQTRKHFRDDPDRRRFLCHQCDKRFFREHDLQRHLETHSSEKNVSCPQCSHVTRTEKLLQTHILNIHTETDKFVCNICGMEFGYKASLKSHQNRHFNQTPYKCDKCDFATASSGGLSNHMRRHRERQYACPICNKLFVQAIHMRRHMAIHNTEKGQHCDFCSYKCHDASNLRKHIKTVHNLHVPSTITKILPVEDIAIPDDNITVQGIAQQVEEDKFVTFQMDGTEETYEAVAQIIPITSSDGQQGVYLEYQ